MKREVLLDWNWVEATYTFNISRKISEIEKIEIDITKRLADVQESNNTLVVGK